MKACPIALQHPSQAQQLNGFGPKLCERLVERMEAHCRLNGLPMPVNPRKSKSVVPNNLQSCLFGFLFKGRRLDAGDTGADQEESSPPKRARKTKARAYVPALRSGAYAIILALSTLSDDARESLSKQDVIVYAQPHCDSSFTAPSDPSKFYTAWASMKTLETKELVYRFGRPTVKYALTDEGWEVARRMKETVGLDNVGITEPEREVLSTQRSGQVGSGQSQQEQRGARGGQGQASRPSTEVAPSSIPRDAAAAASTSRASHPQTVRTIASSADPDFIEILDSPPPRPSTNEPKRITPIGNGREVSRETFMKELENCIFDTGSGELDDLALARALVTARQRINKSGETAIGRSQTMPTRSSADGRPSIGAKGNIGSSSKEMHGTRSSETTATPRAALRQRNANEISHDDLNTAGQVPRSKSSFHSGQTGRDMSAQSSLRRSSANATATSTSRLAGANNEVFEPIEIPPGSFTVELIVDTREVRTKVDRNYIPSNLATLGVHCTSRAMELGDMLWVAKIHDPNVKRRLDLSDHEIPEIVLDYIVERKRLDDLDASIKDSRFTEQKFRLKRSGVQNLIYLVEDYGSVGYMPEEQHQRMVTSITATQVIDGLFVKRSRKLDDTIAYLARMTKLLKKQYERKALTVIPSSALTPQNHISLRSRSLDSNDQRTVHYITYASFASLVQKSGALTMRDVFLKMLMCTRGITGEKAIEIQRHWETPHAFVQELKRVGGDEDKHGSSTIDRNAGAARKKDLVWSVAGNLVGRRKIGKAVSARVGEIWGFEGGSY